MNYEKNMYEERTKGIVIYKVPIFGRQIHYFYKDMSLPNNSIILKKNKIIYNTLRDVFDNKTNLNYLKEKEISWLENVNKYHTIHITANTYDELAQKLKNQIKNTPISLKYLEGIILHIKGNKDKYNPFFTKAIMSDLVSFLSRTEIYKPNIKKIYGGKIHSKKYLDLKIIFGFR